MNISIAGLVTTCHHDRIAGQSFMLQRACPNMIQITSQSRICWNKVRKATPVQNALRVTLSLRTNWSLHVGLASKYLAFLASCQPEESKE